MRNECCLCFCHLRAREVGAGRREGGGRIHPPGRGGGRLCSCVEGLPQAPRLIRAIAVSLLSLCSPARDIGPGSAPVPVSHLQPLYHSWHLEIGRAGSLGGSVS